MSTRELAKSLANLASDMLGKAVDEGQQLAFSPWSLIHTLFIFMKTAKGKSVEELVKALGLSSSVLEDSYIKNAIKTVSDDKSTETAAGVFARKVVPTKEYKDKMLEIFGTAVEPLISASQVNNWCAEATHRKITQIIGDLSPDEVMILISAIYFKADWESPFDVSSTKNLTFTKLDGSKYETPMMNKTRNLRYHETGTYISCRLPYTDSNVNAVIVLPRKQGAEELKKTIKEFDSEAIGKLMYGGDNDIILTLPKFKISSSKSLKSQLFGMGAKEMFRECDTKDTIGENTFVSDVFQKCIVEVDEKGTVAAAVTGMMMRSMCMPIPRQKIEMRCDRPFLFYLVDVMSQIVLFSTVILNP